MSVQHHFAVRLPDLAQFPAELDGRLATHGLQLRTQKELQVGERVGIQFRFPQREQPLLATGVIGWVSAQADPQGRRAFVVRELQFDDASRQILDLVRSTPAVEESEVVAPPPAPKPAAPTPPAATPPAPKPEAGEPGISARPRMAPNEPEPEPRSRKGLWIGLVLLLLTGSLAAWIFAFGGSRWIAMLFMHPPAPLTLAAPTSGAGVPPPLPAPRPEPRAAPRPPAVAHAVGFDYFQRPAVNEFIVTFNRPVGKVVPSRSQNPLTQIFYVENARTRLEKPQFFLPYDLVRTVTFEDDRGALRISFLAQRSDWLPQPVWEVRGRELIVRFDATRD